MERTDIEQWKGREVARLLALVETERRYYQEMVATLPVALAVLSIGNVIISANRAFREMFGLRPDEVRRRTMDQLLPRPELLEKVDHARVSIGATPSFLLETDDKAYTIAAIPMRNWDDETEVEVMLMISDVTSVRQQARATLAEAIPPEIKLEEIKPEEIKHDEVKHEEVKHEEAATHEVKAEEPAPAKAEETAPEPLTAEPTITEPAEAMPPPLPPPPPFPLENMPAVVWVAAMENDPARPVFTHVSDSASQILGHSASDWMATPDFFSERIHAEDREGVLALYQAAVEHGQEVSADFRAHTADGKVVWCRETVHPSSGGTMSGVLSLIGARKQLEQQKVAQERYSALQHLSAQLAHDLNNPLMIITGYAEELLHHMDPKDPRTGDLREILVAAERMSAITGQLTSFTRHPESAPESVELSQMLETLKAKIDEIAGGANMVYLKADAPVWASANRQRLEEIVLALVAAVHDAPQEKVAVSCGVTVISEQIEAATLHPGTYAHVAIRSDAVPADPATKRTIVFEPVLSKSAPPSGAAATQAYAAIHSWGGDLTFTSEPSQGSLFTLFLPLAEEPAPAEPEAAPSETPAEHTPVAAPAEPKVEARETILVVDDEPGIRALVAKILRRERYDVVEAGSAHEALSAAEAHPGPIQLLLTDVMLPDRSGRQVAEQLSAAVPALKVLYISGFTDDESVRAGEFPPGSRFLQKPFTVGALVGKVREALEQ